VSFTDRGPFMLSNLLGLIYGGLGGM